MIKGGGFIVLGIASACIALIYASGPGSRNAAQISAFTALGFAISSGLCMIAAAIVNGPKRD